MQFLCTLIECTQFSSVQLLSYVQLCDPMDCSMPGLPVHHQLLEFTQTHVHWLGDAIQPSHPVIPFSFCLQSFPASGSFWMSQFFASGGQRIGVSASTSVLPMNTQDWSPLWWTGWISLQSKRLSRVFSNTIVQKHQLFGTQLSLWSNSHLYMTSGKTIALTRWIFVGKVMSLLFNMLSRLVITFLPRSKCLLISWLQSPSEVILEPPKIKSATVSTVSPSICHEVMVPVTTHSSILAWRIPGMGGAWWAAVYGIAQSWTRLKWLSSSSNGTRCSDLSFLNVEL